MQTFSGHMSDRHANAEAPLPFFRRAIAALGVALVLLLSASAASPGLHHHFHGDGAQDAGNDNCAVVLFANGLTLAVAAIGVAAPHATWSERAPQFVEEILLASPRYLRQPERGPPVC